MANKTDYAYLAGIIDGEGSISIVHDTSCGWECWHLMVQVNMCATSVLDKLVGVFGGRYCEVRRKPNNNFKPRYVAYHWALNGRPAYEMLKHLKPYLVEKKEQADIGIKFYIYQKHTTTHRRLPESVIRKRETFLQRLKSARVASLKPIALAETECGDAVMGEATVQPG